MAVGKVFRGIVSVGKLLPRVAPPLLVVSAVIVVPTKCNRIQSTPVGTVDPSNFTLEEAQEPNVVWPREPEELEEQWLCETKRWSNTPTRLPIELEVNKQTNLSRDDFKGRLYSLPIFGASSDGDIHRVVGNLQIQETPLLKPQKAIWRSIFSSEVILRDSYWTNRSLVKVTNPSPYPLELTVATKNAGCRAIQFDPGEKQNIQLEQGNWLKFASFAVYPKLISSFERPQDHHPSKSNPEVPKPRTTRLKPTNEWTAIPWKWGLGSGLTGMVLAAGYGHIRQNNLSKQSKDYHLSNIGFNRQFHIGESQTQSFRVNENNFNLSIVGNKVFCSTDGTNILAMSLFTNDFITITPSAQIQNFPPMDFFNLVVRFCAKHKEAAQIIIKTTLNEQERNSFLSSRDIIFQKGIGHIITRKQATDLAGRTNNQSSSYIPTTVKKEIVTVDIGQLNHPKAFRKTHLRDIHIQHQMIMYLLRLLQDKGDVDAICLYKPKRELLKLLKESGYQPAEGRTPFEKHHWYVEVK